jgi:ABC-type nitrate/sulfonate/bicarbonate transport system ATPase subunit
VTALLQLQQVMVRYETAHSPPLVALEDITLTINQGEFVGLVGPSGCGKSTLLALIAGLQPPTAGTVALHGDKTAKRLGRVAYMPQRDLLLPWRTALDNAIIGLEVQGVPRRAARARARQLFAEFGLAGFERANPALLSGGMRQRVAFTRTVLVGSDLLLLDEPFGALDALTRTSLQEWLAAIWGKLDATCLFVTHDIDEALLLADRVYVLSSRPGRVCLERHIPLTRSQREGMFVRPEIAVLKAELRAALFDEQDKPYQSGESGAGGKHMGASLVPTAPVHDPISSALEEITSDPTEA